MRNRALVSGLAVVIALLVIGLATARSLARQADMFQKIFDGQSLAGWVPEHSDRFKVHDGVILQEGAGGWLRSEQSYGDFELELEFRLLKEGAESGLLLRAGKESEGREPFPPVRAYQLQISGGEENLVLLGYGVSPPRYERKTELLNDMKKPPEQWRKLLVKAEGTRLEVSLDGVLITSSSKIELKEGHLGLLAKNGPVEWREIRVRALKAP